MKMQGLFKPIDEFLFRIVEEALALPFVRKVADELQALPENQQKAINQILTGLILFVPILLLTILVWSNQRASAEIEIKKEILKISKELQSQKQSINSMGQGLMGPSALQSEQDFTNLMRDLLRGRSISPNSVNISHFDQTPVSDGLVQSIIGLSFSELTTQDITNMLVDFIQYQKVKVQAVEIQKNPTTSHLQGSVELIHFSRQMEAQ